MKALQPLKTILLVALIAITVACGYSSKMTAPVAGTMPTVSALSPNSATAGSAAFTMTVNGTNFASKAVVNLNGTAQTANTTFVSGNQLMVSCAGGGHRDSGYRLRHRNQSGHLGHRDVRKRWDFGGNLGRHELYGELGPTPSFKPQLIVACRTGCGHRLPALPAPRHHTRCSCR